MQVEGADLDENKIFINSKYESITKEDLEQIDIYSFFDALIFMIETNQSMEFEVQSNEQLKLVFLEFINTVLEDNNLALVNYKIKELV
jgi:hypothetical protein